MNIKADYAQGFGQVMRGITCTESVAREHARQSQKAKEPHNRAYWLGVARGMRERARS